MGTSLTGLTPATTYDALIKIGDNGPLSATAKILSDGLGNDSVLALSTTSVGIGTSSPSYKLDVDVSVNGDWATRIKNDSATGYGLYVEGSENSGQYLLGLNNGLAYKMVVQGDGNVGIGTSSPVQKLSVVNGSIFTSRTDSSENIIISDGTINSSIQQVSHLYLNSGGNSAVFGDVVFRTKNTFTEMARFTQNGLCFNGDTAAANALDDYEEGTWTPTFVGSTTNPTITYAVQSGFYTKIGRQVTITLEIGTSANTGGVGSLQVSGLPFTVASRVYNGVGTYNINNPVTNPMGIFAEVNALGTKIDFLATGDNTTWTAVNWTDATNAVIYINGSFTYFV